MKCRIFIFALFLMILFGSVEKILACSCVPTAPCQSFGRADVVFVGKVIGSKQQRTVDDYETINEGKKNEKTITKKVTYDVGEIYFEVSEVFNGAENNSRITIYSNTGGGDCGFWFKRGESYLVFASKESSNSASGISSLTYGNSGERLEADNNRLWTTICSGTREAKSAQDSLNYLRNLPKAGSGGTIVGRIDETIRNYKAENLTSKPMNNAKIQAQSVEDKNLIFYGTSNQNGYFEIKIPVGNYLVTPILESNLTFNNRYGKEDQPIKIEDRKCESKIFWVSNNSSVSGKIIDAEGNIYDDLMIELIPFDKKKNQPGLDYKFESVEEDGTFSFKGVPLGRYILSVNFTEKPEDDSPFPTTFYPKTNIQTQAKIFEIGYGTKISDIVFQLPPKLVKRKINGTVVWKNGKPAIGAEVQLKDIEADRDVFFKEPVTNAKGEFSMEWFEGRQYKIKVIMWQKSSDGQSGFGIGDTESKVFTLDDKTQKFKIVLNANNPSEKSIIRKTVRVN
jgi:Tissue inhibitor of metalloproteinase